MLLLASVHVALAGLGYDTRRDGLDPGAAIIACSRTGK